MPDLICLHCGHIFDEGEAFVEREYHDEIPGGFYEDFISCPLCGSDQLEKASHCQKCGGSFLYGKLHAGYYCGECLEEAMTVDNMKEFLKDPDMLDAFAEWLFEKEEKEKHGSDPLEETH